jgi:hypothetical protein
MQDVNGQVGERFPSSLEKVGELEGERWILASTGNMYQMILGKTRLSQSRLAEAMDVKAAIVLAECRYFQYSTGQAQDPSGRLVQLFNHQLLPFPMCHEGGIVTLVPAFIIETEQSETLREQVKDMLEGIERMETEIRSKRSGLVLSSRGPRGSVHGH